MPIKTIRLFMTKVYFFLVNGTQKGNYDNIFTYNSGIMEEEEIIWLIERVKKAGCTHLDLSNKDIVSLPEEIGELTQLETLDISFNHISKLPDSIVNLVNLENLFMMRNSIKELPQNIDKLGKLKSLDVSFNPIHSLPPQMGKLDELQSFDASFCLLHSIPSEMINLQKITRIHFDENPIDCPPLKVIRRGWNAIKYFLTERGKGTVLSPSL